MNKSHKKAPTPTPLAALICLATVARLKPDWAAIKLGAAAAECDVSPQRLSRLCSRAIDPFETTVDDLTRMGRPPADKATDKATAERDIMAALLEVASSLLAQCRLTGPVLRALVVGAWLRLKAKHPSLTKTRFCEALAVPERTFRQWLKTNQPACKPEPKPNDETPKPPKTKKKRPPRRGRFSFAVVVPDTQVAADTTDIKAFGVVLKLVAAQDVGGRDQDLFDSVIIEDHENADLVIKVLLEALRGTRADKVLAEALQGLENEPLKADTPQAALDEPLKANTSQAALNELPGANTPQAALDEPPDADTPQAALDELPDADTPQATEDELPGANTPQAALDASPDAETPDAETPDAETPPAALDEPPRGDTPQAAQDELPDADTPQAAQDELPDADTPQAAQDEPPDADTPPPALDEPPDADTLRDAPDELPDADTLRAAPDNPPNADTPPPAQDEAPGRSQKPTGAQGKQAVSDQGTPYVAHKTRDALDKEGVDHAPQREGDPTGKATIERAFRTVKSIAEPILGITNRLAESIEDLRDVVLAKAMTIVLVTALLKAYQAGARAARRAVEERSGLDEQALFRAAQASRERAHAEDQSARMLLSHIHDAYHIGGLVTEFIRTFRRFPLPVLHRAERAFGAQAHRDDIRDRKAYFTKLVRSFADEYRTEQAIKQQGDAALEEHRRQAQQHERQLAHWKQEPNQHLQQALEALGAQWNPSSQSLLFGGVGLGPVWIKDAVNRLAELHGPTAARDIATGIFDAFARQQGDALGPAGISAIEAILGQHLPERPEPQGPKQAIDACAPHFGGHNLNNTGPPSRPDTPPPMRT